MEEWQQGIQNPVVKQEAEGIVRKRENFWNFEEEKGIEERRNCKAQGQILKECKLQQKEFQGSNRNCKEGTKRNFRER